MDTLYDSCSLCGRNCLIDRNSGKTGYCGETAEMRIACASVHFGEEPPITGKGGSGTIFFTGCTLGCAFCQNHQISRSGMGKIVSTKEFSQICLALEKAGAENINLVTGGHFLPSIIEGIGAARAEGSSKPVFWNSSGYDTAENVSLLSGTVDAWLPDLKTLDPGISERFFKAPDYSEAARESLLSMAEKGPIEMEGGLMRRGLMVRHLVLPGMLENTRKVLEWFAENLNGRALLSLMSQYTPILGAQAPAASGKPPGRFVSEGEYEIVVRMLDDFGLDDGYCQELLPGSDWLPNFEKWNPFVSELSRPVWHWKTGFSPA